MRHSLVGCLLLVVTAVGCRAGTTEPDPDRPDRQDACPAGEPHLLLSLRGVHYEAEQALLRFDQHLSGCQGLVLPQRDYGMIGIVAGLPDGTDLVAFNGSSGGQIVRFNGSTEIDRLTDPEYYPRAVSGVSYEGGPAVAILWANDFGGRRLDIVSQGDLTRTLGSWPTPYDLRSVARALSGGDRVVGLVQWDGLQEYRVSTGAESLAMTGELQVAMPPSPGSNHTLVVEQGAALVSADNGLLFYRSGDAALLGPRYCRWPAVVGTPLPEETADYIDVAFDLLDPDDAALTVVRGSLNDGSEQNSHLFRLQFRGECERIYSVPNTHIAFGLAWSGR